MQPISSRAAPKLHLVAHYRKLANMVQSFIFRACLISLISIAGCQSAASTKWRPTADEPPHEPAMLSATEQRQVRQILGELARDHVPDADRSPEPITWRDVRQVVDAACSDEFMAVAQVITVDDTTRIYRIRTIDEKPAELTVTRIGDGLADFRAEATVGLFEDEFIRATKLAVSFEQHLAHLRDRRYAAVGRTP